MKRYLSVLLAKTGFHIVRHDKYFITANTSIIKVKALIKRLNPKQIDIKLIRLGPDNDGGYLIPDDLTGIKACFSPGVDRVSEFEEKCINLGMKVYMADKTVEKPNLKIPSNQYDFIKKHIGYTNNSEYITMDNWVNSSSLKTEDELLLQMDIEGGEYYSLLNMSDSLLKRFRILVIEFHSLDDFWNPHFFNLAESVFDKIMQTHTCVHIHPNNCQEIVSKFGIDIPRLAEFTFLRNDRANFENNPMKFPHQLDYDNTNKKHLVLPTNWYDSK